VLDRIVANGSRDITPQRPEPEPALPGLRRQYPHADDEELILRYLCPEKAVDETYRQRAHRMAVWATATESRTRLSTLFDLLATASQVGSGGEVVVNRGDMRLRVVGCPES